MLQLDCRPTLLAAKSPLKQGLGGIIGGEGGWRVGVLEGGKATPRHQCGASYAIPTNTGNNQVNRLWPGRSGAGQKCLVIGIWYSYAWELIPCTLRGYDSF